MGFKYEKETRKCLDEIADKSNIPISKDEVRSIMANQKLDMIKKHEKMFRKIEVRALKSLSCVNYSNIEPTMTLCSKEHRGYWLYYRTVVSSAPYTGGPGRVLFFLCIDKRSGGVLGVAELRSDLVSLGKRDKEIGWTREARFHRFKMKSFIYQLQV